MENSFENFKTHLSALKTEKTQPIQKFIEITKAKRHLDNAAYEHSPHMQNDNLVSDKYAKATPNYNPTDSTEARSHHQHGKLIVEMKKARGCSKSRGQSCGLTYMCSRSQSKNRF